MRRVIHMHVSVTVLGVAECAVDLCVWYLAGSGGTVEAVL